MNNNQGDETLIDCDASFRYVQWRSFLVRRSRRWRGHRDDRDQLELVEFQPGIHYKFYYSQDESDQGVIMETNLPTKDVRNLIMWLSVTQRTSAGIALSQNCKSQKKIHSWFASNAPRATFCIDKLMLFLT